MKKGNTESTFSILAKQVESYSTQLATFCQIFIDGLPKTEDNEKFHNYLHQFSFEDEFFIKFIKNCTMLATQNPKASFVTFRAAFPHFDSTQIKPDDNIVTSKQYFTSQLRQVDYKLPSTIAALQYFITQCNSAFTIELLNKIKPGLSELLHIVSIVESSTDAETKSQNPFMLSYLEEASLDWSRVYYLIGKIEPNIIWDCVKRFIQKRNSLPPSISHIRHLIFSSVPLGSEIIKSGEVQQVLTQTIEYFQAQVASKNKTFIESTGAFIQNLTLQLMKYDDSFGSTPLAQSLYTIAQQGHYELLAGMSNFYHRLSFKEFLVLSNTDSISSSSLHGVLRKMYGCNYEPPAGEYFEKLRYKWRPETQVPFDVILKWLTKPNQGVQFEDYPSEIAEIFVEISVLDFDYFIHVFIPAIISCENTINSLRVSLFMSFHTILANKNIFIPFTEEENEHQSQQEEKNSTVTQKEFNELEDIAKELSMNQLRNHDYSSAAHVIFTAPSFTESLSSSMHSHSIAFNEMLLRLGSTSRPIFNIIGKSVQTATITNRWMELTDRSLVGIFGQTLPKEVPPSDQDKEATHILLFSILRLGVLIHPDPELLKDLCYGIFSSSPKCGALAMRVLQALVHLYPSYASIIISVYYQHFFDEPFRYAPLVLTILTLNMVVEAACFASAELNEETLIKLEPFILIGLFLPQPAIRQKVFEMIHFISVSRPFRFQKFLLSNDDLISRRATQTAQKAISFATPAEMNMLPVLSFETISSANIPTLYIFYLSTFGHILTNFTDYQSFEQEQNFNFTDSLAPLTYTITELLLNGDYPRGFLWNAFAFLLSIADSLGETNSIPSGSRKFYELFRIQMVAQKIFSSIEGPFADVFLMGMASNISKNLLNYILPLLCKTSMSFQRTLTYSLCCAISNNFLSPFIYSDSGKPIIVKDSNPSIDENISIDINPTIWKCIHGSLCLIRKLQLVETNKIFVPLIGSLRSFGPEQLFIRNFCIILQYIFDQLFKLCQKPQILCENTYVTANNFDNPFDNEQFFTLFCNLTCSSDLPFIPEAKLAFANWTKICKIPDKSFTEFSEHLCTLAHDVPQLGAAVFGRYAEHLLSFFVEKAQTKFIMFHGLAAQLPSSNPVFLGTSINQMPFSNPNSKIAPITPESENDKFSLSTAPILGLYYKHWGELISLCMFHLTSKQFDHRNTALHFMRSLVVLASLFRNDHESGAILLRQMETIEVASFSALVQTEFGQLNSLLAEHFSFCSEQFVAECFAVVKSTFQKSKPKNNNNQQKISSNNSTNTGETNIEKVSSTGSNEEQVKKEVRPNSFKKNKEKEGKRGRISTRGRKISIFGDNVLSEMGTQRNKCNHVLINKAATITSLIASWIVPFNYDIQRPSISASCEPQFQQFGIYTFISALLELCEIQGMTSALAKIVDILINNCAPFLMVALFNLQMEHENAAMKFFMYLYNKQPDAVAELLSSYFTVSCWFFYEIQISKVDQMFNMAKFLNELNDKTTKQRFAPEVLGEADSNKPAHELNYRSLIEFALKLALECRKENPDGLINVMGQIVTFCYLQASNFELADQALRKFVEERKNLFISTRFINSSHEKLISSNITESSSDTNPAELERINEVANFLMNVIPFEQMEALTNDMIGWGLCCGDLTIATRALKLCSAMETGASLSVDALPAILRALQITCAALQQRTDPSQAETFKKISLLNPLGGNQRGSRESFWVIALKYIEAVLGLLEHFVVNSPTVPPEVFWAAAEFLKCSEPYCSALYTVAISIIANYSSRAELLSALTPQNSNLDERKSPIPNDPKSHESIAVKFEHSPKGVTRQSSTMSMSMLSSISTSGMNYAYLTECVEKKLGLASLMFNLKVTGAESINQIFDIIVALVNEDLLVLLANIDQVPTCLAAILYAIVPYYWGRDSGLIDIEEKIQKYLHLNDEDTELIINIINSMKPSLEDVVRFSEILTPLITQHGDEMMHSILNLFGQIAHYGTAPQRQAVFCLCGEITGKILDPSKLPEISQIAYYAILEESNEVAIKFTQHLVAIKASIDIPGLGAQNIFSMRAKITPFPMLHFRSSAGSALAGLSDWAPSPIQGTEGNIFADPTLFPPLYISDLEFYGCAVLTDVKKSVEKVTATPFTKWSEMIFQAQLQTASSWENSEQTLQLKLQPKMFFAKLLKQMGSKDIVSGRRSSSVINSRGRHISFAVAMPQGEETQDVPHPSVFFPSDQIVANYGADLFKDTGLPPIFRY